MQRTVVIALFVIGVSLLVVPQDTKFSRRKAYPPPSQGNIVGKTISANVGQEVQGPLGTANVCDNEPFDVANGGPILYWEKSTGWEYGYMFGPQNREVFGRHTFMTAGSYTVEMRLDAACKGKFEGYHDVVRGQATVQVQ